MNRLQLSAPLFVVLTCAALSAEEPRPKWLPSDDEITLPEPGKPLSPQALVTAPAVLPNVASWTLETRDHRYAVAAAAISPDGALLASAAFDGQVRVANAKTNALKHVLLGHLNGIDTIAFSRDSGYLAVAGNWAGELNRPVLQVWRLGKTARLVRRRTLPRSARRIAWSPRGELIAWQGLEEDPPTLYAWRDDRQLADFGITGSISGQPWSVDGKLATTDKHGVHIWDVDDRKAVRTIRGEHFTTASWSYEADYLAVLRRRERRDPLAQFDWEVEFWDVPRQELLKAIDINGRMGYGRVVYDSQEISWSPDGMHLACMRRIESRSTDEQGNDIDKQWFEAKLWDVAEGKATDIPETTREFMRKATGRRFTGFSWSADGRLLATALMGAGQLIDASAGKSRSFGGLGGRLPMGVPTIEGQKVVSFVSSSGNDLLLWDLSKFQSRTLGHWDSAAEASVCTLSPGGEIAAAVQLYERVATKLSFWDTDSGKLLGELKLLGDRRAPTLSYDTRLVWSPDGARLAWVDDRVYVFDARSASRIHTVEPYDNDQDYYRLLRHPAQDAAWSPDGASLAVLDASSVVVTYFSSDKVTRRLVASIPNDFDPATTQSFTRAAALGWSSDGRHLAMAGRIYRFRRDHDPRRAVAQGDNREKPAPISRLYVWTLEETGFGLPHQVDLPVVEGFEPLVAFSPKADAVACVAGKKVLLIDLELKEDGDKVQEVAQLRGFPLSLRWDGDSRLLYTADVGERSFVGRRAIREFGTIDVVLKKVVSRTALDDPALWYCATTPLSFDGRRLGIVNWRRFEFLNTVDGARLGWLLPLATPEGERNVSWLAVDSRGNYKTIAGDDDQVVFVVLESDGEYRTLTPEEFEKRYGWKNDPQKARLAR